MGGEKPVLVKVNVGRREKTEFEATLDPDDKDKGYSWPPKWASLDLQGDELFLQAELRAVPDRDVLDRIADAPGAVGVSTFLPLSPGVLNRLEDEHVVEGFVEDLGATVRDCLGCGALVAGGPTRCGRCADREATQDA